MTIQSLAGILMRPFRALHSRLPTPRPATSMAAPAHSVSASEWHTPPQPSGVIPRNPLNGSNNWQGLFNAPSGNTPSPNPIKDKAFQQELLKYGYLLRVAYTYYEGPEYQKWLKDNKDNGNPKSTLPMGNLPRMLVDPNSTLEAAEAARSYDLHDDVRFYIFVTAGLPDELGVGARLWMGISHEGPTDTTAPTNCIGYVAISAPVGGKRDIAVVFRGTETDPEWVSDFNFLAVAWNTTDQKPVHLKDVLNKHRGQIWVEAGFENLYRRFVSTPGDSLSVQGQVQVAVRTLLAMYGDEVGSITVTGHSLGGALASICAFDLAYSEINQVGARPDGALIPVTAITFCGAAVGNQAYANFFDQNQPDPPDPQRKPYLNMFRVVNDKDIVPKAPPPPLYVQGGIEVEIDTEAYLEKNPTMRLPGLGLDPKKDAEILLKQQKQRHNLEITLWLLDHSYTIQGTVPVP